MRILGEPAYNTPRIKSVQIENVRKFKKLNLKFSPGLNVVSTVERGSGKSTLLALLSRSIQDGFMLYGPNVRHGARTGHLRVEYEPFNFTFNKNGIPGCYGLLMLNDFKQLKAYVREIPNDQCFLLELDWFSPKVPREDILKELSKARCQVIATVMECQLRGKKLPKGTKVIEI